jgi:hypothetical protein
VESQRGRRPRSYVLYVVASEFLLAVQCRLSPPSLIVRWCMFALVLGFCFVFTIKRCDDLLNIEVPFIFSEELVCSLLQRTTLGTAVRDVL